MLPKSIMLIAATFTSWPALAAPVSLYCSGTKSQLNVAGDVVHEQVEFNLVLDEEKNTIREVSVPGQASITHLNWSVDYQKPKITFGTREIAVESAYEDGSTHELQVLNRQNGAFIDRSYKGDGTPRSKNVGATCRTVEEAKRENKF